MRACVRARARERERNSGGVHPSRIKEEEKCFLGTLLLLLIQCEEGKRKEFVLFNDALNTFYLRLMASEILW